MSNEVIRLESYRPSRRIAITRVAGAFIVCTYIGSQCVKRDHFESREAARAFSHVAELRAVQS